MIKFIKIIRVPFFLIITLTVISASFFYSIKSKTVKNNSEIILNEDISPVYIGPRENIPDYSPVGYDSKNKKMGFWSFAIPVNGILSRSGQPSYENFKWLKENGWRGIINTREDGEYKELSNDQKIAGFNELNFNYLSLPIKDNTAPSNEQAEAFLNFVTNPENQPTHLHCRAGIGRTGTLIAVYRYSIQGWPLEDALREAGLYNNGLNEIQSDWLEQWAKNNQPGGYLKQLGGLNLKRYNLN